MEPQQLQPQSWYWVRRHDGSLAAYRFHRVRDDKAAGQIVAEFFVGSMVQGWPLSHVVGEAHMPECGS